MRMLAKALSGLVLLLLTSGCFVETETTLSDPGSEAVDPRLLGNWYASSGERMELFAIADDPERKGVYRIVYAKIHRGFAIDPSFMKYRAWHATVGGRHYAHVQTVGEGEGAALMIVSYEIDAQGKLILRLMEDKPVIEAIKAGALKGRTKRGDYKEDVTITAPRDELAAFIAANHGKLFGGNKLAYSLHRLREAGDMADFK